MGLAFAALLQGCSPVLLEREYATEQVHEERGPLSDRSVLRADSQASLKNAILELIGQRVEHGVIRLYNYPGDVGEALSAACLEVKQNDPMGAYAVDYITHDFTRIVSYYEVNLYISYRRSYEEIKNVVTATGGGSAMKDVLQQALGTFSASAALRISDYADNAVDADAALREAYDAAPGAAFGLPEWDVAIYPDHGADRLIEVTLVYQDAPEMLRRRQEQVMRSASALTEQLEEDTHQAQVSQLYQRLKRRTVYSPTGGGTVDAALIDRRANSEGIAMAMALLCQEAGIPCAILRGTNRDAAWVWNRMTLEDGSAVEFDAAAAIRDGTDVLGCHPAGQMEGYAAAYEAVREPLRADHPTAPAVPVG